MDHKTNPAKQAMEMTAIWQAARALIQEQLAPPVFDMWIKPLRLGRADDPQRIEILASNDFSASYVRDHYGALLTTAFSSALGQGARLLFHVDPDPPARQVEESPASPPPPTGARFGVDGRYTFENFVVGSCNQFAHAAAARVADAPATAYNPLYIQGGVGLGKTHLLHAIGNALLRARPESKTLYITSEKFMTQLVDSLRFKQVHNFKENFRSVDVLLVDDIQFIAGKKATQEEFFHTFNALQEANKQIVISSDSYPGEIEHLEERLRSRFSQGLVADIHPPDLETRMAILKKKAAVEGMELSDDVAFFLAEAIQSNVRELEGALIRVFLLASLEKEPVTLSLVRESLRGTLRRGEPRLLSMDKIIETVAAYYKIRPLDIRSDKRARRFSHPRQVAMFLCKQLTKASYPEIAREFGDRNHTTVLYAVDKIASQQQVDVDLEQAVGTLAGMLRK
ncbi:Chromosomal replication initiator protein DnaA [Candidatus Magnetaquicoccaceae bacterium FCR-1]|uniref:Chromosomal replication initiator protein DnaA n=2 Tax=Candidatus Magnetaquiglobus chichijimensis TaxID=3141448 RepID=A0ABQ0CC64_9PROT